MELSSEIFGVIVGGILGIVSGVVVTYFTICFGEKRTKQSTSRALLSEIEVNQDRLQLLAHRHDPRRRRRSGSRHRAPRRRRRNWGRRLCRARQRRAELRAGPGRGAARRRPDQCGLLAPPGQRQLSRPGHLWPRRRAPGQRRAAPRAGPEH